MAKISPYKMHIRGGGRGFPSGVIGAFLFGVLAVIGGQYLVGHGGPSLRLPKIGGAPEIETVALPKVGLETNAGASFSICGAGGRQDCVVDGDTFWAGGVKIRIADIDAPETHPSHCGAEEQLGKAATVRLAALLNAGPFTLRSEGPDEDRYGRKLRIVERDGRSLGTILVSEGLARDWIGHRAPWC